MSAWEAARIIATAAVDRSTIPNTPDKAAECLEHKKPSGDRGRLQKRNCVLEFACAIELGLRITLTNAH